jgi:hypothetical protein
MVAGLLVIGAAIALPANAAPTSCTPGVVISMNAITPSSTGIARVGDTIDYQVIVQVLSTQCDLDNGTITVTHPDSLTQTLITGVTATHGAAAQTFDENTVYPGQTPSYQRYVVSDANVVANGTQGGVNASSMLTATAHQTNGSTSPVTATPNIFVQVIHPETMLTKSASPTTGPVPFTPVYTFLEKNTSDTGPDSVFPGNLTSDAIDGTSIVINDTGTGACSPIVPTTSGGFNVGDTNMNGKLDPGETWTFTCNANTYTTMGSFVNSATASGNAQDGREAGTSASSGAPQDEASNRVTVTATQPPVGNIFEVTFQDCQFLQVGYNRFPDGIVVNWDVTVNGKGIVASGSFITIGGGKLGSKTYHFITIPLGVTLPDEASGIQSHAHFHWGNNQSLSVTRDSGC